jgi:hypothetical protein
MPPNAAQEGSHFAGTFCIFSFLLLFCYFRLPYVLKFSFLYVFYSILFHSYFFLLNFKFSKAFFECLDFQNIYIKNVQILRIILILKISRYDFFILKLFSFEKYLHLKNIFKTIIF